nr:hypothetical protein [uncultured Rhodoferax sp.]
MARDLKNPVTPQDEVNLAPLRESHEATQLEAELKELFTFLFEQYVRPQERETNTAGTPHIGPFVQVERAVKAEGLALIRKSDDGAMRRLFRSWRARNPKRGLHILRAYLQLLWPNAWTLNQMWADKAFAYPLQLISRDGGNHFLTSRVHVYISASTSDSTDVLRLAPVLRSVLPARIFLKVSMAQQVKAEMSIATAMYAGTVIQHFEGDFYGAPSEVAIAQVAYQGATLEAFSGGFA